MEHFSAGAKLFVVGLAKKVLLANQFGMLWDAMSADPVAAGALGAWCGACAYTLQIYFDFAGYSDMARGLGRMLGFEFCINFNYPYISKSVTEFWRRWHISLSTWFRDYVYIPLGGNRCGKLRQCVNILIVWALTGFWHGAGWNFLFWGFYYGVLLLIEKLVLGKFIRRLPKVLQHVYAMVIVVIGWVFFASPDLSAALGYLGVMFSGSAGTMGGANQVLPWLGMGLLGVLASTPLAKTLWEKGKNAKVMPLVEAALVLAALVLCTGSLVSDSYNPFLYFRF
jgi:alginate O-acetyltransferase complex protein AlgI